MDLTILDYVGLPEGSILSVRSGPTRRQSALPCSAPFRLPPGPWPLRIDVLGLLGKTTVHTLAGEDSFKLPLEGKDGRHMSVTFQIGGSRPKAGREEDISPAKRRDAEADARAYLDKHRLHEFMHGLFELLLRERPEDPYGFMAKRFQQAACMEGSIREAGGLKVSRSSISTAPTSSPSVMSSMSPSRDSFFATSGSEPDVPEGSYKVLLRTMRGRSVTRLVVSPTEKVGDVKQRLESTTGAHVSAIQLLWLGEMLPNATTLQDWFVEPGPVVLNVICAPKGPKLRHVISGASEGMRLWNPADAEKVRELTPEVPSAVLAMSADWETMRLLCTTFDGRMQLWNIGGTCVKSIVAHSEEACCLEVDWASEQALSGCSDGVVKHWCLKTFRCLGVLHASSSVDCLSVDWPKKRACGGLRTGAVRLWDLESAEVISDFEGPSKGTVSGMAVHVGRAVTGFEDGHLAYWHFGGEAGIGESGPGPTGPKVFLAHYSALRSIVVHWSSSRALVGSDDGSLSLWRLDSSECLARRRMHSFIFCHLFFQLCEVCSPRWLCLGSACRLGEGAGGVRGLRRLPQALGSSHGRVPSNSSRSLTAHQEHLLWLSCQPLPVLPFH
ncbi:unnamed protein product [Effrenium voratum]|nr:unnamed protein product [Effrenium voratum]